MVAFDRVPGAWSSDRVRMVIGDAASPGDVAAVLATAEELAPLARWVNNAAVFEDASLATSMLVGSSRLSL